MNNRFSIINISIHRQFFPFLKYLQIFRKFDLHTNIIKDLIGLLLRDGISINQQAIYKLARLGKSAGHLGKLEMPIKL